MLEGRADGIFTDTDGTPTIDEIKTTTLPPELITGEQSPEHWAQAQIYAAIYARQQGLPAMRVRLPTCRWMRSWNFTSPMSTPQTRWTKLSPGC